MVAAPALVVVAAIIAILARRTPLVRHRRVGWRGTELPVLKFRTMWQPSQQWAPVFTHADLDEHYGPSAEAVLSLRPGLTGLWQLMGRSRLTYSKRKRLDLRLVRCASPR